MIEDDVIKLLHQVRPLDREPAQVVPATDEELGRFERVHNIRLPAELTSWFQHCNGAKVNPGGFVGLFSKDEPGSLDWYLNQYAEWKSRAWFPIASDGCGDLYVMTTEITIPSTGTHPVCFLDQSDFSRFSYAVASGVWKFLYLILENEILHDQGKEEYWPFEKESVLAIDPALAECKDIPLPWEVDEK